jgi:hypothetical protein
MWHFADGSYGLSYAMSASISQRQTFKLPTNYYETLRMAVNPLNCSRFWELNNSERQRPKCLSHHFPAVS